MPPASGRHAEVPDYLEDVQPDMSTDQLVQKLQINFNRLREVDSGDAAHKVSKKQAEHFAQDAFRQHKNNQVRSLIAACLAEMFRIFVGIPDDAMSSQGIPTQLGPLSDVDLLKDVFDFFIEYLSDFLKPSNAFYTHGYHVAQVMASTKAFTLLFNLDDHQKMLEELVQVFFNVISDKHTAMARMIFLDVMATALSDAEAIVSHPILTVILLPLTPEKKRVNPAAYALSKELLKRIPKEIEPCISSYFMHLLTYENYADVGDIRGKLSMIILELFNISPQLVSSALKHVEGQVSSPNVKERLECLMLIGELFASEKFPEISPHDKDLLFRVTSGRLRDVDERIRVQAMKVAQVYICSRKNDKDKSGIKECMENVKSRLMDPVVLVRAEAVRVICAVCTSAVECVPSTVVEDLSERFLDKEAAVREAYTDSVCEMFSKYMYASGGASSAEKVRSKIGPLLPKIFEHIRQLPEKNVIEEKIHAYLLPLSGGDQNLANHIVYFYACVAEKGLEYIEDMVRKNLRARELFLDTLSDDPDKIKDRHIKKGNLLRLFPELGVHGFEDLMTRLQDDHVLRSMAYNYARLESDSLEHQQNALDGLLARCGKGPANVMVKAAERLFVAIAPLRLSHKLCVIIYATILDVLNDHLSEAVFLCRSLAVNIQPEVLRQRGARFLQLLARYFPRAFTNWSLLDRMLKFWRDRDPEVAINVQRFFAYCAHEIEKVPENATVVHDILEKVMEFATDSIYSLSPVEAKFAVRCVDALAQNRLESFRDIVKWATVWLKTDEQDDSTKAVAACALGELAARTDLTLPRNLAGSPWRLGSTPDDEVPEFQQELVKVFEWNLLPHIRFDKEVSTETVRETVFNRLEERYRPCLNRQTRCLRAFSDFRQLEAADVSDNDWKDRDQLSPSVQFCLYSIKAWGKFCRAYPNRLSPSRVNAPVIRKYHDKLKECISDSSQHLADLDLVSQEHLFVTASVQLMKTAPLFFDSPADLVVLLCVIPKLSYGQSLEKFLRKFFKTAFSAREPGAFLAVASTGALYPDPASLPFHNLIRSPLNQLIQYLRKRIMLDADKYQFMLPELGVMYLMYMLVFSKDWKDSEHIADSFPWLEKHGSAIYCLIDAVVTDNQQHSVGALTSLIRLAKHSHIIHRPRSKKMDLKLYVLCDFTSALLEQRYPQAHKVNSVHPARLPADMFEVDEDLYKEEEQLYFSTPLGINRRSDGTVTVWIGPHERSASSDSDGRKGRKSRSKRSRSEVSNSPRVEPEPKPAEALQNGMDES